jgi:signal transduction histidine kinase
VTPIDYPLLLISLSIDLVLLYLLAYVFFYRRHRRRDVFVAISLINMTLFVLGGALGTFTISIGVGFALFSVISIFRLRSETLGWNEIVYLLVALAMGLTLGVPAFDLAVQSLYATILVVAVYVVDHPKLFRTRNRQVFTLTTDYIQLDQEQLKNQVESQLGHEVKKITVRSVTTQPATMKLEVEA